MTDSPRSWQSRATLDAGLSHSLDLLADTYNYNHWIYSLCRPWLGTSILEVGAGTGNLTQFMLGARRLVCVEPEAEYQGHLVDIVKPHLNTTLYQLPIQELPERETDFDSALCVNVLEHIEDDRSALRAMAERVHMGGYVVLYVPAVMWAYGALDKELGHFRRYHKSTIRRLASECGLRIAYLRYINFIGLLGWWWSGRIRKESLIDPRKARFMDRLVPVVSALERLVPVPVGQSILAVFQKQDLSA
jgi:SAM-dependent methyltransferase